MTLPWAIASFLAGLVLVVGSSERLVEATLGASRAMGLTPFLVSVLLIGFDPENLGVGAVASYEQTAGLALGTIIGAAMVAMALAFGVTAVTVPLQFDRVPRRVLGVPVAAVALLAVLSVDGILSRIDGLLLLIGYAGAVLLLLRWERQGLHVVPTEAVEEERDDEPSTGVAIAWMGAALVGVVVGSEVLVRGARPIIAQLGWTDTVFGMTVLAVLVSGEELARELPAALQGRPDISFGNVVGSALAFFGFNAGIIALVRPVPVDPVTLYLYLPICAGTVVVVAGLMAQGGVSRWGGALLVLLYGLFASLPAVL